jgi:hypothetical protein
MGVVVGSATFVTPNAAGNASATAAPLLLLSPTLMKLRLMMMMMMMMSSLPRFMLPCNALQPSFYCPCMHVLFGCVLFCLPFPLFCFFFDKARLTGAA